MLEYLVTSHARRMLLLLLWVEKQEGSARELAELAGVGAATAHDELKGMQSAALAVSVRVGARDVYSANWKHPASRALRNLLVHERSQPAASVGDDELKGQLVTLGAPLRGVAARPVRADGYRDVLLRGVVLGRRDPTVARVLPLCLWRHRDVLEPKSLAKISMSADDKHAVGFLLEITSMVAKDPGLLVLAKLFADRRMTGCRRFFVGERSTASRDFPVAAKWGFEMSSDLSSFQALFDKFERA